MPTVVGFSTTGLIEKGRGSKKTKGLTPIDTDATDFYGFVISAWVGHPAASEYH
jgi:hypothetical protein